MSSGISLHKWKGTRNELNRKSTLSSLFTLSFFVQNFRFTCVECLQRERLVDFQIVGIQRSIDTVIQIVHGVGELSVVANVALGMHSTGERIGGSDEIAARLSNHIHVWRREMKVQAFVYHLCSLCGKSAISTILVLINLLVYLFYGGAFVALESAANIKQRELEANRVGEVEQFAGRLNCLRIGRRIHASSAHMKANADHLKAFSRGNESVTLPFSTFLKSEYVAWIAKKAHIQTERSS